MRDHVQFLHAMAHALSAMTLYTPKHPSVRTAVDTAFTQLGNMRGTSREPVVFSDRKSVV